MNNYFRFFWQPVAVLATALNPGAAFCMEHERPDVLIPARAIWRYQADRGSPPDNWREPGFDDSNWRSGAAGFGYGDEDDQTRLTSMRGRFDALRIRHRFEIKQPDSIDRLFLYIRYDDAFIAYVNGSEIASSGVRRLEGNRSIKSHEADEFELFPVVVPERLLRKGSNVIAIEGFNRSLDSSDFSLDPVLTTREVEHPELPLVLTREQALKDLKDLERRLEDQSSYLFLNKFDYGTAFRDLRERLGSKIDPIEFARDVQKLIAQIGDAHAEVKTVLDKADDRYLPFVLADSRAGLLALSADHNRLLDDEYPIIKSIDGKPVSFWLEIASRFVAQASPQLIRHESLREVRALDRIRSAAGISAARSINVKLQSFDGLRKIDRTLETSTTRLPSGKVPLDDSRILEGNIGYLRIPSMSNSNKDEVLSAMEKFRDTDGLIIDVRDNKGGRYGILRALYGYFIADNTAPYVANIAAYRLAEHFERDHLHYRPTYRLSHPGWTSAERNAVEKSLARFKPEWQIPRQQFSAWHFMLLGRSGESRQYFYRKPVAVLSNAASFSATDGFLSAFSDLPQVTLIGQPSSGGSGATQNFRLANSGVEIALSSMASFRPNGKRFDGNGIAVDIPVSPRPGDFLGQSDAVLEKALEWFSRAPFEPDS